MPCLSPKTVASEMEVFHMTERDRRQMSGPKRVLSVLSMSFVLFASAGCDNSQELRDIEEGRDNPPAVDESPPEEQN